ncbi:hypothetical protein AGMMS49936_09660 [Endomicrobiia bacterium]|nr:hypothetical protein AGMMS49936_09660 [Endomicrobiia bacterium]
MGVDILASIGSSVDNVDGAFESSKGNGKGVLGILEGDGALGIGCSGSGAAGDGDWVVISEFIGVVVGGIIDKTFSKAVELI